MKNLLKMNLLSFVATLAIAFQAAKNGAMGSYSVARKCWMCVD
jgi:hypothetical protein